jgi:hypothetical protein
MCIDFGDEGELAIYHPLSQKRNIFSYDRVFAPGSTQEQVPSHQLSQTHACAETTALRVTLCPLWRAPVLPALCHLLNMPHPLPCLANSVSAIVGGQP